METTHKIIIGDSRKMIEVPDKYVLLIITSPPYWQLKDYGCDTQIGYNDTYEKYINNLNLVWNECYRVLNNGCRLCINIGDQFASSVLYGRYKIIPIHTEIIKFCENIGFDYMGAIIWNKVTTTNTSGGATIMGSYPNPRNGILTLDYEYILIFKKDGKISKVSKEIKDQSKMTKEEWRQYFKGHWNFAGEKKKKHVAMFPEELPKRLIKMFSFVGETVLDPFCGSGTTSLACKNLDRNSIGYEINENYSDIIKNKVGIELTIRNNLEINIEDEIEKLDYIFIDNKKLNRIVDPNSINDENKYYSVKEIIDCNTLILNNNLKIKLLGIKEIHNKNNDAINFLKSITKNKKVFLKYDNIIKCDSENNFCYLYLKNKTFINAHLIKNNLVEVDTSINYKYKSKFIKYAVIK